jgi:sterol desaturase/sphingolipid hydroxylase (fatty acid hydroxylase superfamily)
VTLAVPGAAIRHRARRLYRPAVVVALVTAGLVWFGFDRLERARSLGPALAAGRAELLAPALVVLVAAVLACERRWPAERRAALARGPVQDACYLALHLAAVVPLMTLLGVSFGVLLAEHARWMELPRPAGWPRWLLVPLTLVLMDGANWLAHWADHRSAVLWRFHALHHSQEELSVLTSFRAHPLSHLAGFFLATVPVIALMGGRGVAPALITGYVCLGTLPHANLAWSFGPLGRVIVSPAYHRLQHSFEGAAGLNLGVVLTIWDVLSGRARFPQPGALACPTGLPGRPVPTEQATRRRAALGTLAVQLADPFWARPAMGDRGTGPPRSLTGRVPLRPEQDPGGRPSIVPGHSGHCPTRTTGPRRPRPT